MSVFKDRWVQLELWDCEIFGHEWELEEYITGYNSTVKWTCLRCEEIYDGR